MCNSNNKKLFYSPFTSGLQERNKLTREFEVGWQRELKTHPCSDDWIWSRKWHSVFFTHFFPDTNKTTSKKYQCNCLKDSTLGMFYMGSQEHWERENVLRVSPCRKLTCLSFILVMHWMTYLIDQWVNQLIWRYSTNEPWPPQTSSNWKKELQFFKIIMGVILR